jgi:hypothetical protein
MSPHVEYTTAGAPLAVDPAQPVHVLVVHHRYRGGEDLSFLKAESGSVDLIDLAASDPACFDLVDDEIEIFPLPSSIERLLPAPLRVCDLDDLAYVPKASTQRRLEIFLSELARQYACSDDVIEAAYARGINPDEFLDALVTDKAA